MAQTPNFSEAAEGLLDRICNEGSSTIGEADIEPFAELVRAGLVKAMANLDGMTHWTERQGGGTGFVPGAT